MNHVAYYTDRTKTFEHVAYKILLATVVWQLGYNWNCTENSYAVI